MGEYWSDYTKEVSAFKAGSTGDRHDVAGDRQHRTGRQRRSRAFLPKEGSTGWSDTWMVAAKAKHPNCAYLWADYIVSPEANAQVAEYFGEAPANLKACRQTSDKSFCRGYHARGRGVRQEDLVLVDARSSSAWTAART